MAEPEVKDVLEAGAKALFGPVHELFLKLTGPAAEEYGLMWAESVRMRRTKRLVRGLAKTKQMVVSAAERPHRAGRLAARGQAKFAKCECENRRFLRRTTQARFRRAFSPAYLILHYCRAETAVKSWGI